mmetsp:Transcript_123635/g.276146  ORF Transcript_123635/g.276146 Transcript_123635/m.276146 type:complete len:281 (-) Transcript_123635:1499-2341(-)
MNSQRGWSRLHSGSAIAPATRTTPRSCVWTSARTGSSMVRRSSRSSALGRMLAGLLASHLSTIRRMLGTRPSSWSTSATRGVAAAPPPRRGEPHRRQEGQRGGLQGRHPGIIGVARLRRHRAGTHGRHRGGGRHQGEGRHQGGSRHQGGGEEAGTRPAAAAVGTAAAAAAATGPHCHGRSCSCRSHSKSLASTHRRIDANSCAVATSGSGASDACDRHRFGSCRERLGSTAASVRLWCTSTRRPRACPPGCRAREAALLRSGGGGLGEELPGGGGGGGSG